MARKGYVIGDQQSMWTFRKAWQGWSGRFGAPGSVGKFKNQH